MAKRLKSLAAAGDRGNLAETVRDSAQQIWLAGLGAFSKAQEEGQKVFDALVKEGKGLESRTRKLAEQRVEVVTTSVGKAASKATAAWDRMEHVFESRVERALVRLGVPTNRDIKALTRRVEDLTKSVQTLTGAKAGAAAKAAARRAPAKRTRARKAKA